MLNISVVMLIATALSVTSPGMSLAAPASVDNARPAGTHRIVVTEAWARATVPGQPVGAAYMTIVSPVNTTLLEAQTDVARAVEIHDMHQHHGVMKMRAHGPLKLAANQPVELTPGETHFMLLGLKQALKVGDTLQLKLTFGASDKARTKQLVVVDVPVRPIGQ